MLLSGVVLQDIMTNMGSLLDLLNKLIQNTNLNVFSKRVSDKNLSFTSREIFAGKFEMKSDHKVHFDSPLN